MVFIFSSSPLKGGGEDRVGWGVGEQRKGLKGRFGGVEVRAVGFVETRNPEGCKQAGATSFLSHFPASRGPSQDVVFLFL